MSSSSAAISLALSSARAGCLRRDLEHGGHLALLGALPHQRLVAAPAQRQGKSIEQDRLAGAGLAGEHGKAFGEIDVEPVDQDDVADGKSRKHADQSKGRLAQALRRASKASRFDIIKDVGGRHKPAAAPAVTL